MVSLLFSPKRFFAERFLHLSSKSIFLMGFVGIFFGLLIGNLLTLAFSHFVYKDFLVNKEPYLIAIRSFNLSEENFLTLVNTQIAYSLLLALLSPIIAYVAPHLFGGALFIFLWLLNRTPKLDINFFRVLECSALSLSSMVFYIIPGVGPIIALVLVAMNVSRALTCVYTLTNFTKVLSIITALYFCFFLSSATLQLLALPVSNFFQ